MVLGLSVTSHRTGAIVRSRAGVGLRASWDIWSRDEQSQGHKGSLERLGVLSGSGLSHWQVAAGAERGGCKHDSEGFRAEIEFVPLA